jgi:hypothetical protein
MNKLDWLKNNWNKPAQGVAAITSAILSFTQPPPEGIIVGDSKSMLSLIRFFVIPIVWLIFSVPARKYDGKPAVWKWFWVTIVVFLIALGVWFGQREVYQAWTCHLASEDRDVAVGKTFTPTAVAAMQKIEKVLSGRELSELEAREMMRDTKPCLLVERAQRDPERVWQPDEIRFRRTVMSTLFVLGVPIFIIALLAGLQTWYCARK